jgi:hypothetical protein
MSEAGFAVGNGWLEVETLMFREVPDLGFVSNVIIHLKGTSIKEFSG